MENTMLPLLQSIICIGFLLSFLGSAAAQTIEITRNRQSKIPTKAEISSLPHVQVKATNQGEVVLFEGVPLSAVLATAGVDTGYALRGPSLTEALVVESAGGQAAVFSLAEIDPTFSGASIILADRRDGKELDIREG
jgi:hypothetical protein